MSLLDYESENEETEIEKAAREAAEQTLANAEAKQHARVLGAGPSVAPYFRSEQNDIRLERPQDFGGDMAVLVKRHQERKQRDF